jgi:hypothetical protein
LKLLRYQLMAYEMLASMLLDVGLDRQALEASQRSLTLADGAGIVFWRARSVATHAIARMRLGALDGGRALRAMLRETRDNAERSQMARCLEALTELALLRGEPGTCTELAAELIALAEGAEMEELAARGRLWRGQALAQLGERVAAAAELKLAAATAENLGRVRLARDATATLAAVGGDDGQRARAAAFAARIADSARECEQLMAAGA